MCFIYLYIDIFQQYLCDVKIKWAFFSALICNVPGMFLLITLCSLTGLALYANYVTCDPLKNNDVANPNQVRFSAHVSCMSLTHSSV